MHIKSYGQALPEAFQVRLFHSRT